MEDKDKVNLGKRSYKEYLIAAYGESRAKNMLQPRYVYKGIRRLPGKEKKDEVV